MRFMLSTVLKDLARWRQDKSAILMWVGIPLLVGGLITSLMDGDGGGQPSGLLLIADQDASFISGLIVGTYSQGELGELITVEKVSLADGRERIDAGEASGLLIIPEGFGAALLDSTPVTLELKTNPSQTILPGIITEVTEVLLDAGFYANRMFAEEITLIQESASDDQAPESAVVAAIAVAFNERIESAAPLLFPPALDLEIAEPPAETPRVSLALLFMPGIIVMAIMFAASSLAEDYWAERELGTLRRLVFAPGRLLAFVAGKALAATVLITMLAAVVLMIGFAYHGVSWDRLPLSIAWIALSGLALYVWFGVMHLLSPNRRAASLVSSIVVFPLLMAGGSFFPLAALPDWIASIGRLTPNGFVADRLTTEITSASATTGVIGSATTIDAPSWLLLVMMAGAGLLLNLWRLNAGFARA